MKILLLSGEGLGNLIQQTPLNTALGKMYDVDLLYYDRYHLDYWEALIGSPYVNVLNPYTFCQKKFKSYDLLIDTVGGNLKKIPCQIYFKKRFIWYNRPKRGSVNEVEENMTIAYALGYEGEIPDLYVNYALWPEKYDVAIQVDTNNDFKTYPYFEKVANILAKNYKVVLIGFKKDFECPKCIDYRGKTTVLQYTGIIKNSEWIITSDSAAMHVAAVFKKKTVAIFGPTSVIKNRPWNNPNAIILKKDLSCSPCWPNYKCDCSRRCFNLIKPEDIIKCIE